MARSAGELSPLIVAPAPHLRDGSSAPRMAWLVSASLLPAACWGVMALGLRALLILGVSVGAACAAEALCAPFVRRFTLADGSAFLTGLLVGLFMPAGVPLVVPAAASAFAILVVKQTFGGLGRNWMNPAMGGLLFALLSWGGEMSTWGAAQGILGDLSPLPPLEALRAVLAGTAAAGRPLAALGQAGYQWSGLDAGIVGWINAHLLGPLGLSLNPGSFDVLVGRVSGRIGTLSAPLLLLGALFLLRKRIVRWEIPVSFIAAFAVCTWVFGGLAEGRGWMTGATFFHCISGSLLLCAFFVAGDPVTSPFTQRGRWVFGVTCGVLAFLVRFYGTLGDGSEVAVALANCAVPLLDRWARHRQVAAPAGGKG